MELILVLVILAIAAAMVAPSLISFAHGRVADDAALRLLAMMQYAQNQSANDGVVYRLYVEPSDGTYQLRMQQAGQFVSPQASIGRVFDLPQGVDASWAAPADMGVRNYVEFDPDGRHDVATLKLTERNGQMIWITCDSMGEGYRIVDASTLQAQGGGA